MFKNLCEKLTEENMKHIWLGQGGLLLISGKLRIVVDPYLSNSMRAIDRTMKRRVKIKKKFLRVKPDMIILTNSHPDHADMATIKKYLYKTRKRTVVLASEKAYHKIYSERIAGRYTNVMFEEGDEWTLGHLLIKGVRCKTDDKTAFGVIIEDSYTGKKVYIAGNTLYNKYLIQDLPNDIDVAYVPISGQYSTMNIADAQRFAKELNAKVVVPFHFGMFDNVNPKGFDCENKMLPRPYEVIPIDAEGPETKKLPPEERLKLGLDEKPVSYPKTLRQAIKAEKAEEKAAIFKKKLVDALHSFVDSDDPTLTDLSIGNVLAEADLSDEEATNGTDTQADDPVSAEAQVNEASADNSADTFQIDDENVIDWDEVNKYNEQASKGASEDAE